MKIGVLRANALGDVIVTMPALHALKTAYPNSELVLIGRENHRELFEGRESPVDRVIPLPPMIQFDRPLSISPDHEIFQRLRDESFDLVLQLHGGGRHSNRFVNLMAPRHSVGAKTEDAEELTTFCSYNRFQHEVLRQFEILSLIDVTGPFSKPELRYSSEEKERGRKILSSFKCQDQIVLVNPGAKDPRRRWPVEKFGMVAKRLSEKGATVLINAGPDEKELAEEVKRFCPEAVIISPTLKDLIGILVNCDLVVSNDTGTMHLALALRIPTVALFWYVNVLGYGPLNSDHSALLIAWENHCGVCGHNCSLSPCPHEESLISEITTSDVLAACQSFLQRSSHHGGENRSRSFSRGIA